MLRALLAGLTARERWHDPRPRAQDPSRIKPISALPAPSIR